MAHELQLASTGPTSATGSPSLAARACRLSAINVDVNQRALDVGATGATDATDVENRDSAPRELVPDSVRRPRGRAS
jgi:hypothetical protein